ncbi:DUF2225 domain-containing protein [Bacillus massilinigeriensis]|uniref:DUF2225 domain-containing protein n=1 Tax=Bacillus mediterraneensis TaxID=1805474 RepID=UPI0008F8F967|nr:DUF2225 domain-containing protein [Bacillus mediterraneensis]
MTEIKPLYDKQCTCLLCNKAFTTKKLRTRFVRQVNMDTDFCPEYRDPQNNPALYHVHVCPYCGFSFTEESSPFFPPGTKDELKDKVCSHWKPHDYSGERNVLQGVQTLKLGAYCAVLKKEKHVLIAGLYLRTAWLYRHNIQLEEERRFLHLAAQEYSRSYSEGDFIGSNVSEYRLLYLIGELSHRLGQHEESVRYFSKVIEKQRQSTEPNVIRMAKERWQEIRNLKTNTPS